MASRCLVQIKSQKYGERVPQFALLYMEAKHIGACQHCYRITRLKLPAVYIS